MINFTKFGVGVKNIEPESNMGIKTAGHTYTDPYREYPNKSYIIQAL